MNNWKEQFDPSDYLEPGYHECDGGGCCGPTDSVNGEKLKNFIETLLAQERRRIVSLIEGMKGILWHDDPAEHTKRIIRRNTINEVIARLTTDHD